MTSPTNAPTPASTPPTGGGFPTGRWGRNPAVRAMALVVGGVLSLVIIGAAAYSTANLLVRTTENRTAVMRGEVERVVADATGEVTIRPGPADQARIERRSTFGFRRPEVSQRLEDGVLTIKVTCFGLGFCHNEIEVTVPPGADVDVSAERTVVEDITGRVTVDCDGGSVEMARLSGPVGVRVDGGSVTGVDLTSEEVRASAGAGSIELSFRRPPRNVDVTAGAGQVVIELPPGETTYRVDAESGAGGRDVSVATDPRSARVIRAYAGAGEVTIRYDVR